MLLCVNFRLKALLENIYDANEDGGKIIIFVETKKKVENINRSIRRFGWPAVCIHGDKSQHERDFVLRGTIIFIRYTCSCGKKKMTIGRLSTILKKTEYFFCLTEFRNKKSSILVATDVAARGLGKYATSVISTRCFICLFHNSFRKMHQSLEGQVASMNISYWLSVKLR